MSDRSNAGFDKTASPYLLVASCIFGSILNIIVISLLWLNFLPKNSFWHQFKRKNTLKKSENIHKFDAVADTFILALAINDLLACLSVVPLTAYMDFHEKSPSFFLCNLFYFLLFFFPAFSSLMLSLIAIDRCIFLCFPFIKWFTVKKVVIITMILVALNTIYSGTFAVSILEKKFFIANQTCESKSTLLVNILNKLNNGLFLFLIFIVAACYLSIYFVLLRTKRKLKENKTDSSTLTAKNNNEAICSENTKVDIVIDMNSKSRKKSTFLFFIVVFSFILCYGIALVGIQIGTDNKIITNLYLFMHAINPLIDIIMNRRFSQDLQLILKGRCCKRLNKTETYPDIPRRRGPKLGPNENDSKTTVAECVDDSKENFI